MDDWREPEPWTGSVLVILIAAGAIYLLAFVANRVLFG
jgi:hypothetical protein